MSFPDSSTDESFARSVIFEIFQKKGRKSSIQHMRCEMRAASLIKRSGWSADMFKVGARVDIKGHPHRDDPSACYIDSFSIDGAAEMGRNGTISAAPVDTSNRAHLKLVEQDSEGIYSVGMAIETDQIA